MQVTLQGVHDGMLQRRFWVGPFELHGLSVALYEDGSACLRYDDLDLAIRDHDDGPWWICLGLHEFHFRHAAHPCKPFTPLPDRADRLQAVRSS